MNAMNEFSIRRLQAGDAKAYHEMRLQMLRTHPAAFVTSLEDVISKPVESVLPALGLTPSTQDSFMLGAFGADNILIGVVGLTVSNRRQERHRGKVVGTYVDPKFARRGIATALMKTLIAEAKKLSFLELLHLKVTSGNVEAMRLYQSVGFVAGGVEIMATKVDGVHYDAIHMHRPLLVAEGLETLAGGEATEPP